MFVCLLVFVCVCKEVFFRGRKEALANLWNLGDLPSLPKFFHFPAPGFDATES